MRRVFEPFWRRPRNGQHNLETRAQKQMGPTLLPTPLSPTRGRLCLIVLPVSRFFNLTKTRLASDVCDRSRSILQTVPEGSILRRVREDTFRVWLRHRRSRRHPACAFTSFYASTQSEPCSGGPLASAKPRPLTYPILNLKRLSSGFPSDLLNREPSPQPFTLPVLRSCLRRSVLPPAKAFGITSLDKRVDSCQRGFRFTKRFRSSALRPFLVGVFCSEDMFKVRSNLRFSKGGKSQLSTFPRISCGHLWTSQPFIALDKVLWEPIRLMGVEGGKYRKLERSKSCATRL